LENLENLNIFSWLKINTFSKLWGCNLFKLVVGVASGDFKFSKISVIVQIILNTFYPIPKNDFQILS
jgi:hypothetical protein